MKKYEMTGECVHVGPVETVGQRGFRKREVVLCEDPDAKYPNCLAWEFTGDRVGKVDESALGRRLTIEGFPSSRAWKDKIGKARYFTSMEAKDVSFADAPQSGPQVPPAAEPDGAAVRSAADNDDEVPF